MENQNEGYSIDQAVEILNGTQPAEVPAETEPTNTELEQTEAEQVAATQPDNAEEGTGEVEQEQEQTEQPSAVDYNLKVKFKANGQDSEFTIAQLIEQAQKGLNYERKMQDMYAQQQQLQQQQQQQQKQETPADKLAKREQQIAEYAPIFQREFGVEFNPWDPAHSIEMMEYFQDKRQNEREETRKKQEAEFVTQQCEDKFATFIQEANKDANLTQFAVERVKQIEPLIRGGHLHNAVSKIVQRENGNMIPFIPAEIDALNDFYGVCRELYASQQQKEKVKVQVPKSVPIKPTVKVEGTTNTDPTPPKKIDFKKIRDMDIDEVAKLL
jgi:hypothetical protein